MGALGLDGESACACSLYFQLDKGSVNNYVLSVPRALGPLIYMRIWHDNSGPGDHADWFLDRVVITDLHTDKTCVQTPAYKTH